MALLYAFVAFVILNATWMGIDSFRLRRLRISRQASGYNKERFVAAFRELGIPDNIPETVYQYYGSQRAFRDFPFAPDDKYSEVLHDAPDDIDEDALALLDRLGFLLLAERVRREYGDKPINTLRDMVVWLDWMRQHQPGGTGEPGGLRS
jgi:hypothetical protein